MHGLCSCRRQERNSFYLSDFRIDCHGQRRFLVCEREDSLMRFYHWILIGAVCAVFLVGENCWCADAHSSTAVLLVQGKVLDSAGSPLSDARVLPYLNGRPYIKTVHGPEGHRGLSTGNNGLFRIEIPAPVERIKDGTWSVKVTRPNFKPSPMVLLGKVHAEGLDKEGAQRFIATCAVSLQRIQGPAFWIALVVFVAVYVLIAFEILHRTLAALLGATLILAITHTFGTFSDAVQDFDL